MVSEELTFSPRFVYFMCSEKKKKETSVARI